MGAALLVPLAVALAPADAQPTPRAMSATATLPESNEAMILSSRVEDAVKAGDFRLAIRLIEQVTELPAELVVTPATRTYYPVWRQGVRLLRRLPPAGVQLYRQLYDAEVAARLEQAAAETSVEALRELFRRYPIASAWPQIGQELMGLLLDRGAYGESVEVARELAASGAAPPPEREAQLVVALGRIQAWDEAERRLAALEEQAAAHGRTDWPDRLRDVRRWLERARGEGPAARESARRFEPLLESELAWDQPLTPIGDAGNFDDDDVLTDAIAQTRRLPLHAPAIAAGAMVVRMRGTLWCLDALTLTPRWRAPEIPAESTNLPAKWRAIGGGIMFGSPDAVGDDRLRLSRDARRFIAEPLHHCVTIAFGLVLSVEALQPADAEPNDTPLTFGRGGDMTIPNELVARELATGRLVWRSGGDAGAPLFGAAIQDAPLAVGDVLVAAVAQGGELRLVALDPPTGRVLRTTTLVGPPTHFPVEGGRCQLLADETTLYVCTGNGVVAAVSQDEFRWKWAAVYPSTLGVHLGMVWWRPQLVAAAESPVDRPLLSADLLVLAPVDSSEIFALDRFTGQERWRVPRAEHTSMLGLTSTGLVLGGSRLSCVDLSDGRTLRWRSVPLELSGRPALRGERIFAPTRGGLLVCDARTGRVVQDACVGRPPDRWTTANVVAGADALFAVAPSGVTRYPDPDATEAACDALRAADERDIRAALGSAWLRLLAADYPAAIELLDDVTAPDERFSETRDRLLSITFVALARDTGEGRAKLDWLRRAASLSLAPEAAARLANLIGATLEEAGLVADALDHYREVLLASPAALVTESDDPALRRAAWLHAAQRVRRCLAQLPAGPRAAYLDSLTAARPEADAARLDRARLVVASEPQMAELRRALTLANTRPELAVLTLPDADDSALPLNTRRALHLARWETHVALGRLTEAAADRAVWNETFAAVADAEPASQPATTDGDDELRRVERIDRALRKLEQAVEAPFDEEFGKRWDMPAAELILDPRVNTPSLARTLLVRDLRDRQVALCSTRVGTQIRKTWDALEQNGRLDHFRERAAAEVFLGNSGELVDADRLAWPAALYGDLAAVPVAGGLVCVGLGPERGGGQRIWELAIPEWNEVSDEFVDRCVGGREGFYFASRPTRVALAGLHDGQVRWQRDLATISVARLYLAGDRLIVVGTGQELLSMSAVFGDDLRRVAPGLGTLRAAHVLGDTLVAWTDDALHALDPTTLEPQWSLAIHGVRQWLEVAGRPWVAFRSRSRPGWNVIDVAAGKPVFDEPLATFSDAALFVVDGGRLLVATSPGAGGDGEQRRNLQLAAYDAATAAELWNTTIDTTVPLNAAQLRAHPDHLPLLLLRRPGNVEGWNDLSSLTIQLLEKSSGTASRSLPVGRHFDSLVRQLEQRRAWCGVALVATPTRVFVQAAGNIVAYGTAPPAGVP